LFKSGVQTSGQYCGDLKYLAKLPDQHEQCSLIAGGAWNAGTAPFLNIDEVIYGNSTILAGLELIPDD
jgi:hypothetical protein